MDEIKSRGKGTKKKKTEKTHMFRQIVTKIIVAELSICYNLCKMRRQAASLVMKYKKGKTRSDLVVRKEMIAMLLAGGQGSRLGVLTADVAKPAVAFGGKYRIIDFPLSNCINSGVDTVGVLTQYQPLRLNSHIGIGIPWELDRNNGGVTVLPPYEKSTCSE